MAESTATYLISKIDNFATNKLRLRKSMEERINELKSTHEIIAQGLNGGLRLGVGGEAVQQLRKIDLDIVSVVEMYAYKNASANASPWYGGGRGRGVGVTTHSITDKMIKVEKMVKSFNEKMGSFQEFFSSHPVSTNGAEPEHEPVIAPLHVLERETVGVEGPRAALAAWVLDVDQAYSVRFVVGMGGSGKTALVKLVYEQLKSDFDCHVWVNASMFEHTGDLLSNLYNKLRNRTGQSSSSSSPASTQDLIDMLIDYLQRKRYLIVLDNWNRKDWESVKYAFPQANTSRVIITTRRGDIASSCRDNSTTDSYKIPPLPFEKAEKLFLRRVFPESGDHYPSQGIREASQKLLKACEGLPLGIVEMGKLLSLRKKKESEFTNLETSLRDELKLNLGKLSRITQVLLLSYNDLPDHLKSCFLYMSMFPENRPVSRRMLIRLWMAEDFIKEEAGRQKEPEDVGEEYLEELMERNLVEASELELDGRPRTCRVHCLMHKIALSKAEAEMFFAAGDAMHMQRLSIQNDEFSVPEKLQGDVHTLLSLTSGWRIPPGIIPNMKLLKILHLDDAALEALPSGIKKLLLLKYLSLSNTRIKHLPISTGRLKLLETLNVKETFVTELPDSLLSLQNLRHLLAGNAVQGVKVPKEIGKLTNLQKLSFVRADKDHRLVQELKNLKKLRKLGIVGLPRNSGRLLCKAVEALRSLRSLSLASENQNQVLEIQEMEEPPQLQRLYLWGRLERMPQWISKLHELVRIRLKWSRLTDVDNPITILGKLSHLLELQLLDAYTGNRLEFCAGTFLKLKILELDQMEKLKWIIICNGALPCLERLTISHCPNLRETPKLHLRDMQG